jgi:hypothetical protein
MASYDFSAPFVAARIVLPNGDAFPLWTNVGGDERATAPALLGGAADLKALCFVQEIQVQTNLSGLPQLSVQLSPPFEDGMKFLDSPLADGRMRNRLEVQLGYAGGTGSAGPILSAPFIATLTAPEVQIDTEIQITLKGQGLGASSALQGGRVTGQDGDTREDIIRRLVAGYGGGRRTLEVNFDEAYEDSTVYGLLRESASGYAQGNRSDWLALWWLAQETRCIMNIVGTSDDGNAAVLRWRPRQAMFTGPPTRRYRLYHYPGGQFRGEIASAELQEATIAELPILSFSCNTDAVWGALTYQDIIGHGIELNEVSEDEVTAGSTTVTAETEAPPADSGEGAMTVPGTDELPEQPLQAPGDPENPSAVRQASADVEAGAGMATQIEIETVGDPAILPGDVVAFAGLGRRFDPGVYHVFQVVHSIGVGGFSTNLTVHKNADPASEGNEPTGERNTAEREAAVAEFLAEDSGLSDADLADITGIQL